MPPKKSKSTSTAAADAAPMVVGDSDAMGTAAPSSSSAAVSSTDTVHHDEMKPSHLPQQYFEQEPKPNPPPKPESDGGVRAVGLAGKTAAGHRGQLFPTDNEDNNPPANGDDENDGDEDDPIVAEYEVRLSKALQDSLYVIQFPLRPASKPYDDRPGYSDASEFIDVRFKPENQKVEFIITAENGSNFDYETAKLIGRKANLGVEIDRRHTASTAAPASGAGSSAMGSASSLSSGAAASSGGAAGSAFSQSGYLHNRQSGDAGDAGGNQKLPFPAYLFDKTVLTSTSVPARTNYVIGVADNKVLYLHPVHGILQMRPSFDYLDMAAMDEKVLSKEIALDEGLAHDDAGGADAVKMEAAIQPTFARRETEKTAIAKRKSHAYIQAQIEQEPWMPLKYGSSDTADAEEAWRKFMEPETIPHVEATSFDIQAHQYMSLLTPAHSDGFSAPSSLVGGTSSTISDFTLPLEERVRSILINAELISTRKLCDILELGDETPAVRAAESCAFVVKGSWVVRSEVLHGGLVASELTGTPIHQLTRARNYMLYLLSTKDYIQKKEVLDEVKIPSEDLNEMFKKITVLKHQKGYTLKLPEDSFLYSNFPEVIERQKVLWEQILTSSLSSRPAIKEESAKGSEEAYHPPPPNGDSAQDQLSNFIDHAFRHYGVCSLTLVKKSLQQAKSVQPEKNLLSQVSDFDLTETIRAKCLVFGDNRYVLKTINNPSLEKQRSIVINVLRNKDTVKRAEVMQAIKEGTGTELSSNSYTKLMKEFAYSRSNVWNIKDGSGADGGGL